MLTRFPVSVKAESFSLFGRGSRAGLMMEGWRCKAITVTTYLDRVMEPIHVATPSRGRNLRLAESQFSKCCGVPSPTRGEGVRGGGVRKSAAVNTNGRAFLFRVSTNPREALPNGGCGFAAPTRPRKKPRPMRPAYTRPVSPWRTHARQNRPVALTHQRPSGIFIISSMCCGLQNIPNLLIKNNFPKNQLQITPSNLPESPGSMP